MPIDASIPLSGIAPKLPSAGDMVSLASMMEQMRERKLASDQKTSQLASEKAMEGLMVGMTAYYGAPEGTPEEEKLRLKQSAQREFFDKIGKSGKAGMYGWTPEKVQEFANHNIAPDRAEFLLQSVPDYKDLIKHGRDVRAGAGEKPMSLQDVGQAQPPAPQMAEPELTQEEADKKYEEAAKNMPASVADANIKEEGGIKVAGAPEVPLDTKKRDPIEEFNSRADAREADATRLRKKGRYDLADRAMTDAKDLRAAANQERGKDQKDTALDQSQQRIDASLERAKATQQPLTKAAVDFAVGQYLNGNSSALTGFARNQVAQKQFRDRIPEMAKEMGMGAKDANAAIANFRGILAEEQTLGHRSGQLSIATNELEGFIPLAEKSIGNVSRTGFAPFNRLIEMGTNQWSEEQRDLVNKTQAVLNAYAQVAARGGISVHSQEISERQLKTADSPAMYKAALRAMWDETQAAMRAPGQAREDTRQEITTGKPREIKPYPGAKSGTYVKEKKAAPMPDFTQDEIDAEMKRRGLR